MSRAGAENRRVAVLLFNLGGPDTLDDVRPFLYNLFADPDIIRLPLRVMQKPLAWLISRQRYKKSRSYYKKIGGGSPLRKITEQQARALEQSLAARNIAARAYVGMRYWHPFIEDALAEIRRDGATDMVVLPLYPQFSISTTGSSLNRMDEIARQGRYTMPRTAVVCSWEDDPKYIAALAASIREELSRFADQSPRSTTIVFSAHSVPVSYIEQGDPYLAHIERTVALVMESLGNAHPHALSFQSKVGPVKWLQPSTDEMIRRLAAEGASQLLLVPVSFVSEHIETLYELDILYRDLAREMKLSEYRRVSALNTRPDFIEALAGLVEAALARECITQQRPECAFTEAMGRKAGSGPPCSCHRMRC